jgi:hypothetical protein
MNASATSPEPEHVPAHVQEDEAAERARMQARLNQSHEAFVARIRERDLRRSNGEGE